MTRHLWIHRRGVNARSGCSTLYIVVLSCLPIENVGGWNRGEGSIPSHLLGWGDFNIERCGITGKQLLEPRFLNPSRAGHIHGRALLTENVVHCRSLLTLVVACAGTTQEGNMMILGCHSRATVTATAVVAAPETTGVVGGGGKRRCRRRRRRRRRDGGDEGCGSAGVGCCSWASA